MIVRFASYEAAAICVGMLRSDGHYAAILDEHMGFMWGPLLTGGFRVIATDDPVQDDEPPPPPPLLIENLLDGIRTVVAAFALSGLFALLVLLFKSPVHEVIDRAVHLQGVGMGLAIIAVAFTGLAPLMPAMTRALRDECSLLGRCVRALVVLHVAAQLALMFAALAVAIWSDMHVN